MTVFLSSFPCDIFFLVENDSKYTQTVLYDGFSVLVPFC